MRYLAVLKILHFCRNTYVSALIAQTHTCVCTDSLPQILLIIQDKTVAIKIIMISLGLATHGARATAMVPALILGPGVLFARSFVAWRVFYKDSASFTPPAHATSVCGIVFLFKVKKRFISCTNLMQMQMVTWRQTRVWTSEWRRPATPFLRGLGWTDLF